MIQKYPKKYIVVGIASINGKKNFLFLSTCCLCNLREYRIQTDTSLSVQFFFSFLSQGYGVSFNNNDEIL